MCMCVEEKKLPQAGACFTICILYRKTNLFYNYVSFDMIRAVFERIALHCVVYLVVCGLTN